MIFQNNQIDITGLPAIDQTSMIPVEKRYYNVLLINHSIFYIAILTIVIALHVIATDIIWIDVFPWILTGVCLAILTHCFIVRRGFKQRKYSVRERDISYVHGWLTSTQYTLPFVRTQHVEIKQGLISKYYNLSNLKVFTAGDGDDVNIKGLSTENAEAIRTFIISKINEGV